jgi:hypothetical protein
MNIYTNDFRGYTTIVVEIEKTLPQYQVDAVIDELNQLAFNRFKPSCYERPLHIVNKSDEDIGVGHHFAVMSQQSLMTIQSTIDDITEIVTTGKLIDSTGSDWLARYRKRSVA